jgi:signal transduction histidine kinase
MGKLQAAFVFPVLDWFVPAALGRDPTVHRRLRMYLLSHIFGTPLGLLLMLDLYFIDPEPGAAYWIELGLILAFYVYPFLLRATGWFAVLAPISVQHFAFVVLFGAFSYGGASSPFFTWLGLVPLAGTFYLSSHARLRFVSLALILVQLLGFLALHLFGVEFPQHVALADLAGIGILSAIFSCLFAAMMSINYASIAAAQQEQLEQEIATRRDTEAQLRRAKDDAERADRAKSAFLANMSHELRTPLNAIIGFAEVIRRETFGPIDNPRYFAYLKDIYDSGCYLLRIINDILDLSKIEAGKATLDREEEVDLARTIEAAARLVQPQADAGSIALSLDLPAALPAIRGSARMLQQVFTNLLSNAVKFTLAGGKVSVGMLRRGGDVAVIIRDTGIGMSEEDLALALAAFGQADTKMARRYDGTGLGLPLAKAIVELHRGRLEIDSYPGRGTTIEVILPISAHAAAPAEARAG